MLEQVDAAASGPESKKTLGMDFVGRHKDRSRPDQRFLASGAHLDHLPNVNHVDRGSESVRGVAVGWMRRRIGRCETLSTKPSFPLAGRANVIGPAFLLSALLASVTRTPETHTCIFPGCVDFRG